MKNALFDLKRSFNLFKKICISDASKKSWFWPLRVCPLNRFDMTFGGP